MNDTEIQATLPSVSAHTGGGQKELMAKYTEQNYKRKTFVFAPIFHELNSKI